MIDPHPLPGSTPHRWARCAALAACSCLLAFLAAAAPGRTSTLDGEKVKETLFPSGLRLIVKEAHATDLAAVEVWIRAGGFVEDENTAGTAHVIEHLLFRREEGGGTIDAEIESLGGNLDAATDRDWTRFSCTLAGRYVGKALTVIGDAIRKPQFRPEDFAAERPVLLEELQQVLTRPNAFIATGLYQLAFRKHPYRLDVRGTGRFIAGLDMKDVRAYYQQHYVPSNMVVVVVGDVDRAGVERAVKAAFQTEATGAKPAPQPLPPNETACKEPERRVLDAPFQNGYVGLAFPAPSVKDEPDVYAMDLLLTVLESGDSGRLPRLLKDLGAVEATFETRRQPGLFTVVAVSGGARVDQVEALLRKELEFVTRNPVPEAELTYAKRSLRGSYALDNEAYTGQAGTLGYYAAIDRWQFATEYLAKIEAVTPAQVQEVARKYLQAEHSVAILLRPRPSGPPGAPRPPSTGA